MTHAEFLDNLDCAVQAREKSKMSRGPVFYFHQKGKWHGLIRAGFSAQYCPIAFVHDYFRNIGRIHSPFYNCASYRAAAKDLGLSDKERMLIAFAADNHWVLGKEGNAQAQSVRQELIAVCRMDDQFRLHLKSTKGGVL